MAAALGKKIQLPKKYCRILLRNLRFSNVSCLSPLESINVFEKAGNRFLSTAVQLVSNEELVHKDFLKSAKQNEKIFKTIDETFAQIDLNLKHTGRTHRWNVKAVLNMIKKAGAVSSTHGLFLLRCCERMLEESPSDRIQLSNEIWCMLQNHGVKFEASHFNSRLKLYVENQEDFSPVEFLSLMEKHDVEPNRTTFSLLLEKFCNDGDLSGASEILESMKTKNIPVTEKVFNTIIKGHVSNKDFAGAENILEVMRSSSLVPNADSYAVLLCGCAMKDVDKMKSYLVKIQNMGISLSNKHLLDLIKALAMSGHTGDIDKILAMMKNVSNYRQEFLNTAIELTHYNLEDIGYKLVSASCGSDFQSEANVFVRHLIKKRKKTSGQKMTIEEENRKLLTFEGNVLSCQLFLVERLMYHVKKKNVDRVSEIKLLLEKSGFEFSATMCAQLIGVFSEANDFEAVESLVQYLEEKYPNFKIDLVKAIQYSTLLIKYGKFEKAVEILKEFYQNLNNFEKKDLLEKSLISLFNTATETGNVDLVKNIQDFFVQNNFGYKEIILKPLVKTYISRNELNKAVECYENALKQYHVAPCLNMLFHRCISVGDREQLEKTVDLTSTYLGKTVAICELAAAFVEAGRPKQGFLALQNLNNKAEKSGSYVENICLRFHSRNKVHELCQFIAITRDFKHSSREKIYHLLLNGYAQKNMHSDALVAWKMMQKEEIHPDKNTLFLLHKLFERNNQPVPNSIIECLPPIKTMQSEDILEHSLSASNNFKKKFIECVNKEEFTLALDEINKMKKGYIRSLTVHELSKFVELLLKKKCLLDLSSNVQAMSYIVEYAGEIFKPILEKCASAGDIDTLKTVYTFLPDFALRKVAFNNFYARAYCASGKHEDLLLELEKNFENDNKFFSTFAVQELMKIPHLENRMLKLCERYSTLDFDLPISVAFAHYFVMENYDKVEEMIKHNSIAIQKGDSQILTVIRQTENVSMGQKFIEILNKLIVKNRTKERAYGVLLDVLVARKMYSEASMLVSEAEDLNLSLHMYHSSTLVTLKNALEKENKPVTFDIPPQNADSVMTLS